jgi:glucose repression regulatory protein TUP1
MYSHRGMGAPPSNVSRLNELLDQIRAEFESQVRQVDGFEHQSEFIRYSGRWRPESHKRQLTPIVSAQVSEMQLVREKVYAMEQTHMTLKQK